MAKTTRLAMLSIIFSGTAAGSIGCGVGDDGAAASEPDDYGEVLLASEGGASCPTPLVPFRHGVDYTFMAGGHQHTLSITYNYSNGTIRLLDRVPSTGQQWQSSPNQWHTCPHPNQSVVLTNDSGMSKTCTHVCLPNGQQELHCPNGQFALSVPTYRDQCVSWPIPFDQGGPEKGVRSCKETKEQTCRRYNNDPWNGDMCESACGICRNTWCVATLSPDDQDSQLNTCLKNLEESGCTPKPDDTTAGGFSDCIDPELGSQYFWVDWCQGLVT